MKGGGTTDVFAARYLEEEQIWERIERIEERLEEVGSLLGQPEVADDPRRLVELSRRFDRLRRIADAAGRLRRRMEDLRAAREMLVDARDDESQRQAKKMRDECEKRVEDAGASVYAGLVNGGFLPEEKEDEIDLAILYYLRRWGAEYVNQLASQLNLGHPEVRSRLQVLIKKGLIERVQGTILKGYHRQRDWVKHMNHTYYELSREGQLYLRDLRN